jgi:hypothetical protein
VIKNLSIAVGIVVIAIVVVVLGRANLDFHESTKTDVWNRDYSPDAAALAQLTARNYPGSIHHVFEVGSSSRANGDGESLSIYSFDPADTEAFKAAIYARHGWADGFPNVSDWGHLLERTAPRNLWITPSDDSQDFVHAVEDPDGMTSCLINRKKGVVYLYTVRR